MSNVAAVLHRQRDLRQETIPDVSAGSGQVVVEVRVVGVCGSDTHYFTDGALGRFTVESPMILGHEAAGVVTAVGEGVDRVAVGDRVAIEPGTPCDVCAQCRSGRYNLCPKMRFMATPPFDGAFTRSLAVSQHTVFGLPNSLSFEEGALLEPLSVGIWSCRRAEVTVGDRVLVSGAGPVGILAAEAARAFGAADVYVTDVAPIRLAAAQAHGFTTRNVTADPLRKEGGAYDVLIECSGAQDALNLGMWQLAPGGRAVMVGIPDDDSVLLDLPLLHDREISIGTIFRYANTWPTAIDLVRDGRVHVADLITHRFPLDQAGEALLAAQTDESVIKAAVLPQE